MGIWVPSMAPKHWGKFHFLWKPFMILLKSIPLCILLMMCILELTRSFFNACSRSTDFVQVQDYAVSLPVAEGSANHVSTVQTYLWRYDNFPAIFCQENEGIHVLEHSEFVGFSKLLSLHYHSFLQGIHSTYL